MDGARILCPLNHTCRTRRFLRKGGTMPKPEYTITTWPPVEPECETTAPPRSLTGVEELLRELFPYGHEEFIPTVLKQIRLHSDKNHDYARGGNPLGNFTRVAAILKLWPGFPYDTPE